MEKVIQYILIIGLVAITTKGDVIAQKKKNITRVSVEYFKDHTTVERLVALLRVKEDRYLPLSNVIARFYSINDTGSVLLDKIKTDENGQAFFKIEENPKIFQDTAGVMTFEVVYNGSSANKNSRKKISVKRADLDMSFFQKDTTKSIEVNVNAIGPDQKKKPIEGLKILFYVKGTFSLLNFSKEKTDENGNIKLNFPVDMPGDTSGVLTIVAKIEEDRNYGTVESRGKINWGIPVPLVVEKQRGLGDTDAPLWMVYTLITLLSLVWFHYLYVIFLIIKIKLANRSY